MHAAIFDARSLYDPAWHASRNREDLQEVGSAASANGLAAAAVARVLDALNPRPTHLFVAWDGPVSKSQKPRGPKPPGFHDDKLAFADWWQLATGGVHCEAPAGLEADDLCASAAALASQSGLATVVSADKDLHQLVSDKVRLYNPYARHYVTEAEVVERWGVARPSQAAFAQALIGDSGDGIKGVPGIGPKRAKLRLARCLGKDSQAIFDELEAEYGQAFTDAFSMVFLNRKVAVPMPEPIVMASPRGYLSPDGELAWRRLITSWLRPKLDDSIGLNEEG